MKIKNLMDILNKDSDETRETLAESAGASSSRDENVVYIENARLETVSEQSERKALLAGRSQWADRIIGDILVEMGKLEEPDVDRILERQREQGLYFGEAAVSLKLVDQEDVLHALSTQFGYTFNRNESRLSREMVMAYSPFGEQAEEFRAIRSQLLNGWLDSSHKTLAVVSPGRREGRSYVAANMALTFSQLGHSTLLIDANMRAPRQHEIFNFSHRVGLSMLLAGRVRMEDLDLMPDHVSSYENLAVLGCGAVPPNPVELLSRKVFPMILRELEKYFDVIIIDTPAASYVGDLLAIASAAGNAMLVTRGGESKMADTKQLLSVLKQAQADVVGGVLNTY